MIEVSFEPEDPGDLNRKPGWEQDPDSYLVLVDGGHVGRMWWDDTWSQGPPDWILVLERDGKRRPTEAIDKTAQGQLKILQKAADDASKQDKRAKEAAFDERNRKLRMRSTKRAQEKIEAFFGKSPQKQP